MSRSDGIPVEPTPVPVYLGSIDGHGAPTSYLRGVSISFRIDVPDSAFDLMESVSSGEAGTGDTSRVHVSVFNTTLLHYSKSSMESSLHYPYISWEPKLIQPNPILAH